MKQFFRQPGSTLFAIIAVVSLVIISAGVYAYISRNSLPAEVVEYEHGEEGEDQTRVEEGDQISVSKKDAWGVFTSYLDAAKNNNLEEISRYSYQISSVCKDSQKQKDCFDRMQNAYNIGSTLNKVEFVQKMEDSKQLILSTKPEVYKDEKVIGYQKKVIIFTKDESGNYKVAGFDPNRRWFILNTVGSTTAELLAEVDKEMLDSDNDGVSDRVERCELPPTLIIPSCEETDPFNRDSDADGWWDGVEPFLIPR
jgi:hypothetical protein